MHTSSHLTQRYHSALQRCLTALLLGLIVTLCICSNPATSESKRPESQAVSQSAPSRGAKVKSSSAEAERAPRLTLKIPPDLRSSNLCTQSLLDDIIAMRRLTVNGLSDPTRTTKAQYNTEDLYQLLRRSVQHYTFIFEKESYHVDPAQWKENEAEISLLMLGNGKNSITMVIGGVHNEEVNNADLYSLAWARSSHITNLIRENVNVEIEFFFTGIHFYEFRYDMMDKVHMFGSESAALIRKNWSKRDQIVNQNAIVLNIPCRSQMCARMGERWGGDRICNGSSENRDYHFKECQAFCTSDR